METVITDVQKLEQQIKTTNELLGESKDFLKKAMSVYDESVKFDKEVLINRAKLAKKMGEVIKATGNVAKKGTNKDQNYKFVTHSDIIEELRKHIAEKGIFILPKPESYEIVEITSRSGTKGAMITMKMDFEIIDTETGFGITVKWFGQGMDYGDKAMYKSYTGALKYFLLDTFMISTGDDPEASEAEAAKPSNPQRPPYNAPKPPVKPIVQPPMSDFQKNKVKGLLVDKNKTQEDVEAYCQKAFKKAYTAITIPEANILIKNLEKFEAPANPSEEVDVDEIDAGIEAQRKEKEEAPKDNGAVGTTTEPK